MPKLIYTAAARVDLVSIARYIEEQSASLDTAEEFVGRLMAKCEQLAEMQSIMGRPREELLPGVRSVPFGNYLIFLRYLPASELRETLEVVNILWAGRDIEAVISGRL